MNKIIYPDANENLYNSLEGRVSTVILDNSYYTNIKKATSSIVTRQILEDLKPDKDHFLIHLVALGDEETYGFNKNADGFPKKANINYHKTFEKYAKFYREHNSSDVKFAIGDVKLAMYNPEMKRVEIVLWGDKKKCEEEYEIAKSGGDLSFSMGASVPEDRDNISGKLCKTAKEYEPWMKLMPGKYIDSWDGKIIKKWAYVHNDKPRFFDISRVKHPADRTAHYLQYAFNDDDTLIKSANSYLDTVIPSAYLPSIMGYDLQDPTINNSNIFSEDDAKLNILKKLAKAEEKFKNIIASDSKKGDALFNYVKYASLNSFDKDFKLSNSQIDNLFTLRSETLFYELAKHASILPFKTFINTFYKDANPESIKYACDNIIPCLFEDVFERQKKNENLHCDGSLENIFDAGSSTEASYDLSNNDEVQKIMDDIEDKLSLDDDKQNNRILTISITNILSKPSLNEDLNNKIDKCINVVSNTMNKKEASVAYDNNKIKKLAHMYSDAYMLYKVAALKDISRFYELDDKKIFSTIAQNFLDVL